MLVVVDYQGVVLFNVADGESVGIIAMICASKYNRAPPLIVNRRPCGGGWRLLHKLGRGDRRVGLRRWWTRGAHSNSTPSDEVTYTVSFVCRMYG